MFRDWDEDRGWHDQMGEPEDDDLDQDEPWRGDQHLDDGWPEELAGPEYWLFKRDDEQEL